MLRSWRNESLYNYFSKPYNATRILAALLRTRGQYDEAERLYREGLASTQQIRDVQGIAVYQMRLGQLALDQDQRQEAVDWLQQARQGFLAIGLDNWVQSVDQQQAQGETLTLDDLIDMMQDARDGDKDTGGKAWQICDGLARSGVDSASALVNLPDPDLCDHILKRLNS